MEIEDGLIDLGKPNIKMKKSNEKRNAKEEFYQVLEDGV